MAWGANLERKGHDCQNNNGVLIWKSRKPMVFFYGHELKNRNEIQVLGEE